MLRIGILVWCEKNSGEDRKERGTRRRLSGILTCKVSAESGMKQKIKNTKERDVERETDPDVKKKVSNLLSGQI